MTTESLKEIVASLTPHVRDALRIYAFESNYEPPLVRNLTRARIEGYLLAARNSGTLLQDHCQRLLDEIKTTDGYRIIGACFTKPEPAITEGERSLYRYKFEAVGSFERALWEAFFAADSSNLANLTNGFPSHSEAFRRYATESGWWDTLVTRIKRGE